MLGAVMVRTSLVTVHDEKCCCLKFEIRSKKRTPSVASNETFVAAKLNEVLKLTLRPLLQGKRSLVFS
jgi:hypothetical protein